MSVKIIPNSTSKNPASDVASAKGGSLPRSPIGKANPLNEDQTKQRRKIGAEADKENTQESADQTVAFGDAVLHGFNVVKQMSQEVERMLQDSPDEYDGLTPEAMAQNMVFGDIELLNASEAEIIRNAAKRKLRATQEESSPNNEIKDANKPKKPRPR